MAIILRRKPPAPAAAAVETPPAQIPQKVIPIKVVTTETAEEAAERYRLHKDTMEARKTVERYMSKIHNARSAIRSMCVSCSGGSLVEVRECRVTNCALHPFRNGENPYHKTTKARLEQEAAEKAPSIVRRKRPT